MNYKCKRCSENAVILIRTKSKGFSPYFLKHYNIIIKNRDKKKNEM